MTDFFLKPTLLPVPRPEQADSWRIYEHTDKPDIYSYNDEGVLSSMYNRVYEALNQLYDSAGEVNKINMDDLLISGGFLLGLALVFVLGFNLLAWVVRKVCGNTPEGRG